MSTFGRSVSMVEEMAARLYRQSEDREDVLFGELAESARDGTKL
jgi:hypothetical protein